MTFELKRIIIAAVLAIAAFNASNAVPRAGVLSDDIFDGAAPQAAASPSERVNRIRVGRCDETSFSEQSLDHIVPVTTI